MATFRLLLWLTFIYYINASALMSRRCFEDQPVEPTKKIICDYYNAAKFGSDEGEYTVDTLPEDCTHIVIHNEIIDEGSLQNINMLRNMYPKKVMIVSFTENIKRFTKGNDIEEMNKFVKYAISVVKLLNIDGIHLDILEFDLDNLPRDGKTYAALIEIMRNEIEKESTYEHNISFSLAIPQGFDLNKYDVKSLFCGIDWIVVLDRPIETYNNEIYGIDIYDPKFSEIDTRLLVLRIPLFSNLYKPKDNDEQGEVQGYHNLENGNLAYFELCRLIQDKGWVKDNTYNFRSILSSVMNQACLIKQLGANKIMFTSLDFDDFTGYCHRRKFPLIKAGYEAWITCDLE